MSSKMWNLDTAVSSGNSTAITIQTSPTAEKETIIIVSLLVTCILSLILSGIVVALVLRKLRRARVAEMVKISEETKENTV